MRIKKALLIVGMACAIGMNAQFTYQWAYSQGGPNNDYGNDITVDNNGNVITCGTYYNTADFDPSEEGEALFTSDGPHNGYISKLDPGGTLSWVRTLVGESYVMSVCTDSDGNIYCGGSFRNEVDFDDSESDWLMACVGYTDAFVAKFSADGTFLWAFSFGNIYHDNVNGISLDADNNIIITGNFSETVDFDPGSGVAELAETSEALQEDAYVAKYDNDGNYIWAKQFAGESLQRGQRAEANSEGDILVAGFFAVNIDCDPGAGELIFENGADLDWQCYLVKLNANGELIWGKSFGGAGQDATYSMAIDGQNNVYATGYFEGTADFDPGAGAFEMTAEGTSHDAFIIRLDNDGSFVWAKQVAGSGYSGGQDIDVLGEIVFSTGYAEGVCDFDPGVGEQSFGMYPDEAIFLSALDTDGNYLWADQTGGLGDNMGFGIVADAQYLYATGYFRSTATNFGEYDLISEGNEDAFIMKAAHPVISTVSEPVQFEMNVFPNPLAWDGILHFDTRLDNATLALYGSTGQQLMTKQRFSGSALELQTYSLPPGAYTLSITENQRTHNVNFVVN
ncbi:MAG: T9SS type A sorting domain-containing protein [Flavobacteriales bacterium]|nr:T9SS type A sorting domain-containing protein [Flavobacteriales bacterium]